MEYSRKAKVGWGFIAIAVVSMTICMGNLNDYMRYLSSSSSFLYKDEAQVFIISAITTNLSLFIGTILLVIGIIDNRIVESHIALESRIKFLRNSVDNHQK